MIKKSLSFLKRHKKVSIIVLVLIVGGGYYYYQSSKTSAAVTSYTLGAVEKGTIVSSVTATGQVSNLTQVDLSPQVSTAVTAVYVKEGQAVKAGDVLVQLDNRDLSNSLTQTKNSLDSAKSSYELKIAGLSAEELAVNQNSVDSARIAYENSLVDLQNAQQSADLNLKKTQLQDTYDSAKSTLNSTDISLRSSFTAADNILGIDHNSVLSLSSRSLLGALNPATLNNSNNSYYAAKESFSNFENSYNSVSSNLTQANIDMLLPKALSAVEDMKDLEHNVYLLFINTVPGNDLTQTALDTYRSSFASQESSMLSAISNLQSATQSIASTKLTLQQTELSNKTSLESAQNSVVSKKLAYDNAVAQYNLKVAAPRDIDLASYKIQIAQAQNNYAQALENLKKAQIIAPIDGVVASVDAVVGIHGSDAAANPTAVTIVTPQQLAIVTLNEVDAAKVKAGQKATLTFNALEDLSITGTVASVDEIGTVSQGVVSYSVKIALDTQDERVKSEMSVTANIITAQKVDVLVVPSSAVKTDNNGDYYIEVFADTASLTTQTDGSVLSNVSPERKTVVVGITDDTNTEIISGLSEGDKIIVKTTSSSATTAKTSSTSSNSALRMLSGGGGGPR